MTDETTADDSTGAAEETPSNEGTIVTAKPENTEPGDSTQSDPADKPEGEAQADKPEGDEGQKDQGAPEEYAEFKVPEGFEHLDKDLLEKAAPLFKESGLSQDKAQEFVNMFADSIKGQTESNVAAFTELNETNKKACQDHKEFGGDNLDGSVVKCAKAMGIMGDREGEFREMLDQTGLGNNPLMFELLSRIGGSMTEDGIVDGGKVSAKKDVAKSMYGEDGTGKKAET